MCTENFSVNKFILLRFNNFTRFFISNVKDTHKENATRNETQVFTKSINKSIWLVHQPFIRGFFTEINFFKKNEVVSRVFPTRGDGGQSPSTSQKLLIPPHQDSPHQIFIPPHQILIPPPPHKRTIFMQYNSIKAYRNKMVQEH